jgi:hypothetical protein
LLRIPVGEFADRWFQCGKPALARKLRIQANLLLQDIPGNQLRVYLHYGCLNKPNAESILINSDRRNSILAGLGGG